MKLRRMTTGLVAVGVLGAIGTWPVEAAEGPASTGLFSVPLREDAFSRPGTDGCVQQPDGTKRCLPPGASMVNLPNGRILYWSAIEGAENVTSGVAADGGTAFANSQSRTVRLDTASPAGSQWAVPKNPDAGFPQKSEDPLAGLPRGENPGGAASLFCSDQVILPDGRVVAFGGTQYYSEPSIPGTGKGVVELEGLKLARTYDPRTDTWSKAGEMTYGRWYPSKTTLADGRVVIFGGVTKLLKPVYPNRPADSGTNVKQVEVFDPQTNKFTVATGADKSLPLYPRMHLLPNGMVFYGAAGQAYNPQGQSYDEAVWNVASVFDPAKRSWTDVGIPGMGLADPTQLGFRGSTFQQMLPLKAPYTKARFLSAGGVVGTTPGSYLPVASARLDTVDTSGPTPVLTSAAAGALSTPRWYGTGISLPTGQVVVFSGGDLDHVVNPGSESPIRKAEMFTPNADGTGGTWTSLASAKQARTYHNNAILLPDGRVLVGGHDPIPNGYGTQMTTPATPAREFANNSKDASFEIFSPPYLFYGPRPEIKDVSAENLTLGQPLTVQTKDAGDIASVVLVRNGAQTHLIDGDQRTVDLTITERKNGKLTVALPASASVLPPGPYMLFINRTTPQGLVPSVSRQVRVEAATEATSQAAAVVLGSATTKTVGAERAEQARSGVLPETGGQPLAPAGIVLLMAGLVFSRSRRSAWALGRRTKYYSC